eukprot:3285065-Rhodomonas_salina.1
MALCCCHMLLCCCRMLRLLGATESWYRCTLWLCGAQYCERLWCYAMSCTALAYDATVRCYERCGARIAYGAMLSLRMVLRSVWYCFVCYYGMSGTELAYGGTRAREDDTELRVLEAKLAYRATGCAVLSSRIVLRLCYGMRGTERGYDVQRDPSGYSGVPGALLVPQVTYL